MDDGHPRDNLLTSLMEGAAAVAGQTDLTSVLSTSVEAAIELTGARYGALGVLDDDGGLQEFIHVGMDEATVDAIGAPPVGRGLLGSISRDGTTVRTPHLADHPDFTGFPENHPDMGSFLGVPVRLGEKIFGNLYLTHKEGGFTAADQEAVEGLAVVAGAAINTARLQRRLRRLAVVEDRERIARDLHDAIIQDLFAVGLTLQAHASQSTDIGTTKVISETAARLDEAIAALRRFIFDLQPPIWSRRDLTAEVEELVAHLSRAHEMKASVTFEGSPESIDPATVDDALQLVSEAVSNALRHSEGASIGVTLRRDRGELLIVVKDDGIGFDTSQPTVGRGLDNLRRRAGAAGGEATIVSTRGSGTVVRIRLPL